MPKLSEGTIALGALIAFAFWILVALPLLYYPPIAQQREGHEASDAARYGGNPSTAGEAARPGVSQSVPDARATAHPNIEGKEENRSELWSAKLTDWLLAAFTLALVFFTRRLYQATAGLWDATKGLVAFAEQQSLDMKASLAAARDSVNAAREANELNGEIFAADQRPWVNIVSGIPEIATPLTFSPGAARIALNFVVRNYGKSPARNVFVRAIIFVTTKERPSFVAEQRRICEPLRHEYFSEGYPLFPGQEITIRHPMALSRQDINASWERIREAGHAPEGRIGPYVIGCLSYTDGQGIRHQTGFGYTLLQAAEGAPIGIGIDIEQGDVPSANLRLWPVTIREVHYAD